MVMKKANKKNNRRKLRGKREKKGKIIQIKERIKGRIYDVPK